MLSFSSIRQFSVALWHAKIKVEPLIFLYLFAWSFYFPLYEQYYYVRFGSEALENTTFPLLNGSQTFCLNSSTIEQYGGKGKSQVVQSQANHLVTYGQLANRIPSIFVVILIGPLSDRFGRKPILLASSVGLVLQSVLAVAITSTNLNPYFFIISNFLTGVCGDITGILTGGFAYISDVSSTSWRTFRVGVVCGLFEVGVALGTFLCGYWLTSSNCNFVPPMWLVLACSIAILIWILVFVRESLKTEDKIKAKEKHPHFYTSLLEGLKLFVCKGTQKSMWKLWATIIILDVAFINAIGNQLVAVFFLKSPPLDVSPLVIGIYQALISVSSGVCATLVIVIFSVVLKFPDSFSALIGLTFQCFANILMGFAKTGTQVFSIAILQGVQVLCFAASRTILSKLVSSEDQGALFSVVISSESVAALGAGILWPLLFPVTLEPNSLTSGSIFYIMAALDVLVIPLAISLLVSDIIKHFNKSGGKELKTLTPVKGKYKTLTIN